MSDTRGLLILAVALGGVAAATGGAYALDCPPAAGRDSAFFAGEVAGQNAFRQSLVTGWTFTLEPAPAGWDLRVRNADGTDLSFVTPPASGPNPRDLYGWHFRNAANTGANTGDVNAPQRLRLFSFFPDTGEMAGVAAARPALNDNGRGALEILDLGLADLEPGQQARLVYLKFEACLSWPEGMEPPAVVAAELIERFGACGLDPLYAIAPYLSPASFEIDLDGDGALDLVAPIVRLSDDKRGLAACRAGTWLDLIGLEAAIGDLVPAYFESLDWWRAEPEGPVSAGVGGDPPVLTGDAITLGKADSSSVLLYWAEGGYRAYWQGD